MGIIQDSILAKLEHYCAYQERSHFEVEQKARSLGVNKEDANLALYHLIQHDFLNEERFAELYARSKMNQKKWGSIKIKQGLFKKRISASLSSKVINGLPTLQLVENGLALCAKFTKNGPINKSDFQQIASLKKMLYTKGYSAQVIEEVLKHKKL